MREARNRWSNLSHGQSQNHCCMSLGTRASRFSDFQKSAFPDFWILLKFHYLNHFLKIGFWREGRRRHGAPLKSRTLSPIHLLLHNSLILLNTIRSGISSFAAHLPSLLCVPTFAFLEPPSAAKRLGARAASWRLVVPETQMWGHIIRTEGGRQRN